jgi:hypothetical protein
MELEMIRKYYPGGTNGKLYLQGSLLCYTIELPWKNNQSLVSCIPEDRYQLQPRYTFRLSRHLYLPKVPGRTWILIHPANNAQRELKGCIAPVNMLLAPGKGLGSRQAMASLLEHSQRAFDAGEPVFLNIKNSVNENF